MGNTITNLLKSFRNLEEQGVVSKDTSLKMRRLTKKLDRAVARQDRRKAQELVAEICEVLLDQASMR
jgi:ribosomal protein S20